MQHWSLEVENLLSDDWCSTYPTFSISSPPTISWDASCYPAWGGELISVPFTPPVIGSPAFGSPCTETGSVFHYWIELNQEDMEELKIAVDSINHRIQIEALSSSIGDKVYTFNVRVTTSNAYSSYQTMSFDLPVKATGTGSACSSAVLTAPVYAD